MKRHNLGGPLIAVILTLIPIVYVASYFALVTPRKIYFPDGTLLPFDPLPDKYRFGDTFSERLFWPIEKLDRKIRPQVWQAPNPRDPYDWKNFEDAFDYE